MPLSAASAASMPSPDVDSGVRTVGLASRSPGDAARAARLFGGGTPVGRLRPGGDRAPERGDDPRGGAADPRSRRRPPGHARSRRARYVPAARDAAEAGLRPAARLPRPPRHARTRGPMAPAMPPPAVPGTTDRRRKDAVKGGSAIPAKKDDARRPPPRSSGRRKRPPSRRTSATTSAPSRKTPTRTSRAPYRARGRRPIRTARSPSRPSAAPASGR